MNWRRFDLVYTKTTLLFNSIFFSKTFGSILVPYLSRICVFSWKISCANQNHWSSDNKRLSKKYYSTTSLYYQQATPTQIRSCLNHPHQSKSRNQRQSCSSYILRGKLQNCLHLFQPLCRLMIDITVSMLKSLYIIVFTIVNINAQSSVCKVLFQAQIQQLVRHDTCL